MKCYTGRITVVYRSLRTWTAAGGRGHPEVLYRSNNGQLTAVYTIPSTHLESGGRSGVMGTTK